MDTTLPDLITQLPAHLPGDWEATTYQEGGHLTRTTDNLTLSLHTAGPDRLGIHYVDPQNDCGTRFLLGLGGRPHISVATRRGPQEIARDIRHRLLPACQEIHTQALTWLAESNHTLAEQQRILQQFRQLGATLSRHHPGHAYTRNPLASRASYDVQVHSPSNIQMTLYGLDEHLAVGIARLLAGRRDREPPGER